MTFRHSYQSTEVIRTLHSVVTSRGPAILIQYPVLEAEAAREGPTAVPAEKGGQLQPVPVHYQQAAGDEVQHQARPPVKLNCTNFELLFGNLLIVLDTIPFLINLIITGYYSNKFVFGYHSENLEFG